MEIRRLGSEPPGPWEAAIGYSRVVRAGAHVWVAGCTSVDEYGVVQGISPAEQTALALANVGRALERVDASLADVVRTRLYVTDASRWEEVGRAHGDVFADIRPVTTLVEVSGLLDPRMLVEVEADAFVAASGGAGGAGFPR
ncbi:RidA family protein [Baekduia soli]|uniref:RidA family protein n=1 Tax=Baekduia soli TaxID=496014 RepID=A0A5B8U236_9ACTN|nr:RidA family protein [Baekduia soli]QEC47011.1 RidA family protein [Baekduia soli]